MSIKERLRRRLASGVEHPAPGQPEPVTIVGDGHNERILQAEVLRRLEQKRIDDAWRELCGLS